MTRMVNRVVSRLLRNPYPSTWASKILERDRKMTMTMMMTMTMKKSALEIMNHIMFWHCRAKHDNQPVLNIRNPPAGGLGTPPPLGCR